MLNNIWHVESYTFVTFHTSMDIVFARLQLALGRFFFILFKGTSVLITSPTGEMPQEFKTAYSVEFK